MPQRCIHPLNAAALLAGLVLLLSAVTASAREVAIPIAGEHRSIHLQGEQAAAGFHVHAPTEAQRIHITVDVRFSDAVDRERSHLRFTGNNAVLGTLKGNDIEGQSVRVRFALEGETLRPGANSIQLTSRLQHETNNSLQAAYALHAAITLVDVRIDGGSASTNELALSVLASGPAAPPLYLLDRSNAPAQTTMAHNGQIVQHYAQLRPRTPVSVQLADVTTLASAPGHRIVVGTQEALTALNANGELDALPIEQGGAFIDEQGFVTWVITSDRPGTLDRALDTFFSRLPDHPAGLARPQPGEVLDLSPWLNTLASERQRVQVRDIRFLLPADYSPKRTPDRAMLRLNVTPDASVATEIQLAINGLWVNSQTVPADPQGTPIEVTIPLPWNSYAAGLNAMTLRFTTEAAAQGRNRRAFALTEPGELRIPPSDGERFTPRVAAAISVPGGESTRPLLLNAHPDSRAARLALLTLLANQANLTGDVQAFRFVAGPYPSGPGRAVIAGDLRALDEAFFNDSTLTSAILDRKLVDDADPQAMTLNRSRRQRTHVADDWPTRRVGAQAERSNEETMTTDPMLNDIPDTQDAVGVAIEQRTSSTMSQRPAQERLFLLAQQTDVLPVLSTALVRRDLAHFRLGAALYTREGQWLDFAHTVHGHNRAQGAASLGQPLLARIGRQPPWVIVVGLISLLVAISALTYGLLLNGRQRRA